MTSDNREWCWLLHGDTPWLEASGEPLVFFDVKLATKKFWEFVENEKDERNGQKLINLDGIDEGADEPWGTAVASFSETYIELRPAEVIRD